MSELGRPEQRALGEPGGGLVFNFAMALPGRASSLHTARAYFRWIDLYLVDIAGWAKSENAESRAERMMRLPVHTLQESLSAQQVRAWLGMLARRNHSKQGLDQARAALVTLADLFAEAGWIDDMKAAAVARVRAPRAETGQRPGRWLSLDELRMLIAASGEDASNPPQRARNMLVLTILCTMGLRREELCKARWGDLSIQNNRVVLRVHGKGRKVAPVDVPKPVIRALEGWRKLCIVNTSGALAETPLIRRVWKGGRIARGGITTEGVWRLVDRAAQTAQIGHVTPHDLRRSVAGALHESGVPMDKISRLLRHSSIAVTEKYINRLPQRNEGAVLMSDLLILEDDPFSGWE
jgi:integrase/recombinase XerD